MWAKPGNIGTKVYSGRPLNLADYPFLVSEDELLTLIRERYIYEYFRSRMYCTIDEYVLRKGVTEEMVEKRIGRPLVFATQTYLESQDGQ